MGDRKRVRKKELTPEQKAEFKQWVTDIKNRNSMDMVRLLKMDEFLRYVGRWTKECGCHTSIQGSENNDNRFREGRRDVGEDMLEEIKRIDFRAATEAEWMMRRDDNVRLRIVNQGMKYEEAKMLDEKPYKKGEKV